MPAKKPRAKRTQPKKCVQTTCGNTCIPKSKTCRITDPQSKVAIKQKGKQLSLMLRKEKPVSEPKKLKRSPIGDAVELAKIQKTQNFYKAKDLKKQAQAQLKEGNKPAEPKTQQSMTLGRLTKAAQKQKEKEAKAKASKKTSRANTGFIRRVGEAEWDRSEKVANMRNQVRADIRDRKTSQTNEPTPKQRRSSKTSNNQGAKLVDDIQGKSKSKLAVDREVEAGIPNGTKTERSQKGRDIFDRIRQEEMAQRRGSKGTPTAKKKVGLNSTSNSTSNQNNVVPFERDPISQYVRARKNRDVEKMNDAVNKHSTKERRKAGIKGDDFTRNELNMSIQSTEDMFEIWRGKPTSFNNIVESPRTRKRRNDQAANDDN